MCSNYRGVSRRRFTPGWWKACSSQPVEPWILEQCGLHPGCGPDVYLWKGRGSFTIQSACVLSTYRKLRMRLPRCPCWLYRVCDWTSWFSSELEARERLPLARSRLEVARMGDWMDGPQHCSSRIICRRSQGLNPEIMQLVWPTLTPNTMQTSGFKWDSNPAHPGTSVLINLPQHFI